VVFREKSEPVRNEEGRSEVECVAREETNNSGFEREGPYRSRWTDGLCTERRGENVVQGEIETRTRKKSTVCTDFPELSENDCGCFGYLMLQGNGNVA